MNLSSTLSIGPLNLPAAVPVIGGIWLAAWLAGRLILRRDSESARIFSDLVGSPLLPFLLAWKLSLILTDFRDVVRYPQLLLYSAGGGMNILIGALAGAGWLAVRWFRHRPGRPVNRSLLAALGVVVVAAAALTAISRTTPVDAGDAPAAVELTLTDPTGGSWTASSDRGQVIVLNFWASWCPPCRAEMPILDRAAAENRYSGVAIYAVNAVLTEKSPEAGTLWMEENAFTLPVLLDDRGEGSRLFGISSLPTTIVMDPEGQVVRMKVGAISRSWLVSAIRQARGSR